MHIDNIERIGKIQNTFLKNVTEQGCVIVTVNVPLSYTSHGATDYIYVWTGTTI